jgi:DNA anti-recombination protein RmuC
VAWPLGGKQYWKRIESAPEVSENTLDFVVMYVTSYDLLEDALKGDPDLLAHGIVKRVVIATPTTAIALLLAVNHGWKQDTNWPAILRRLANLLEGFTTHFVTCLNTYKNSAVGLMGLSLVTTR